jgi:hypothetical protein
VVFPYDGPWTGRIEIVVVTAGIWGSFRVVDLSEASTNPVGDAYPSDVELLDTWLRRHAREIQRAIVLALLMSIVAGACFLRKRGRVSLVAFFYAIIGFWCYLTIPAVIYLVLNILSTDAFSLFLVLYSAGLSFTTYYVLLTPKPRKQSSRQLSELHGSLARTFLLYEFRYYS